jgi:hypothetical protein
MPITIVAATTRNLAKDPPGDIYADHELAIEASTATMFDGGSATAKEGRYPDRPISGIPGCDGYHIHEIAYNGIVWKVSVTFLDSRAKNSTKGTDHIGNAFYSPIPGRSRTFERSCASFPDHNRNARDFADGVFERYWEASKKIPATVANERILAMIAKDIENKKASAEKDKADAIAAAKAKPVVSDSAHDRSLFGQTVAAEGSRTHEAAQAMIDKYVDIGKVVFANGDNRSLLVCLKEGRPKEKWMSYVQKYYDGIFAANS